MKALKGINYARVVKHYIQINYSKKFTNLYSLEVCIIKK